MKLGVQPDRVLLPMLNDRMVAKGLILQYATAFFSDYLSSESIDDLVSLLRKARRPRMRPRAKANSSRMYCVLSYPHLPATLWCLPGARRSLAPAACPPACMRSTLVRWARKPCCPELLG